MVMWNFEAQFSVGESWSYSPIKIVIFLSECSENPLISNFSLYAEWQIDVPVHLLKSISASDFILPRQSPTFVEVTLFARRTQGTFFAQKWPGKPI